MDAFKPLIAKAASGTGLTESEARTAFGLIFEGNVSPVQLAGFLMALKARGETISEIFGAVSAMRARMLRVRAPAGAIDIAGTGGDGRGTYNISTLSALITAACGVPVAKHGNRAASSKSGSNDVLCALGAGMDLAPEGVEACIREAGIGFMSARTHHAAMRHAAEVRAELGTRTIFNLIGPLANPACVEYQVIGVFAREWLEPIAHVLRRLGSKRAWIVHGSDGLDEATTTGPTFVAALEGGEIRCFEIAPEDAGISPAALADLIGGDPDSNAAALHRVLGGTRNAYRDIAILNAAIALRVAGKVEDLKEGAALAAEAIDQGCAAEILAKFIKVSNQASPARNGISKEAAKATR
ncbi:MAG: anthranilate phosphoribosyltransferase [Beijerinckiaceae bacterium]|nr:anthranilate phosphoribosyltransferase [Beijerinckiaceae bacterium]